MPLCNLCSYPSPPFSTSAHTLCALFLCSFFAPDIILFFLIYIAFFLILKKIYFYLILLYCIGFAMHCNSSMLLHIPIVHFWLLLSSSLSYRSVSLFTSGWTFRAFTVFVYYRESCYEHNVQVFEQIHAAPRGAKWLYQKMSVYLSFKKTVKLFHKVFVSFYIPTNIFSRDEPFQRPVCEYVRIWMREGDLDTILSTESSCF